MAASVDLQSRVWELERQLVQVQQERDDLQKDVEALCLKDSSAMHKSSSVMSGRLVSAEKELRSVKAQLAQADAERASLQEDSIQLRSTKGDLERDLLDASSRCEHLEKVWYAWAPRLGLP